MYCTDVRYCTLEIVDVLYWCTILYCRNCRCTVLIRINIYWDKYLDLCNEFSNQKLCGYICVSLCTRIPAKSLRSVVRVKLFWWTKRRSTVVETAINDVCNTRVRVIARLNALYAVCTRAFLRNLAKPTVLSGNRKSRDFGVSKSEYALYAHYAAYVSALVQRYRAEPRWYVGSYEYDWCWSCRVCRPCGGYGGRCVVFVIRNCILAIYVWNS